MQDNTNYNPPDQYCLVSIPYDNKEKNIKIVVSEFSNYNAMHASFKAIKIIAELY